ncbi:LysE family transporter [Agromyces sp. CCNWLW203]|uniref:LysE family transporter n=1 Tax=Agromyces sp. CCNWLW203 TaxID=3112842 RepID=UPI002F96B36C
MSTDITLAVLAGVIAGLALAAPLGAIGVLLVQEGILRGLRGGLPAAAAVATVDTLYCAAAVAAGALMAPVIASWVPWPQIVGGVALVALGVHGLSKARRTAQEATGAEATALVPSGTGRSRYLLFLALTAVNPATLLYFAAILPGLKETASSSAAQVGFVVGVALASFAWQTLLVTLGAGLRHRTGAAFRRWTAVVGNGTVVALGALLIAQAV